MIKDLQATEACNKDALEIPHKRFDDRMQIEQNHLAKLQALLTVPLSSDPRGHRKLYDYMQGHIHGLHSLGMNATTYSIDYDVQHHISGAAA